MFVIDRWVLAHENHDIPREGLNISMTFPGKHPYLEAKTHVKPSFFPRNPPFLEGPSHRFTRAERPRRTASPGWTTFSRHILVPVRGIRSSAAIEKGGFFYWLVVDLPLRKILVRLDHHPNYWWNNMFQTSNQFLLDWLYVYIWWVVSTSLKNISQWEGWHPIYYGK